MQSPIFLINRPSVRFAAFVTAGAVILAVCGIAPRPAAAQLLPVTIDAAAGTQCGHVVARADFSEPAAIVRGDRRLYRMFRLQYETTARITEPRVVTVATNGPSLHFTVAQPQFFYFRPWATPAEYISFAQFAIPADVPVSTIIIDTQRGGCASRPAALNDIATVPQMLAEESPVALEPIFPDELHLPNRTLAAAPRKPTSSSRKQPANSAHSPAPHRTIAAAPKPQPSASVPQAQMPSALPARPQGSSQPLASGTPCTQPDQEPHVISLAPVNSRDKGKQINDRPTVGRMRVALTANSVVRRTEVAESTGFPLLDKRMRESALHSKYATKIEACEPVAADYIVRYEIGF